MKELWKQELDECLASEVAVWEARSREDIRALLQGKPLVYETIYKGAEHNVVADLLENTAEYLHVMIEIQPDPERVSAIATPRQPGSGGWTNEQMGMLSGSFIKWGL